jgi:hypothetical protein
MATRKLPLTALLLIISQSIFSQPSGGDWKLTSRLSFYSGDDKGEALVTVPSSAAETETSISISVDENIIGSWQGKARPEVLKIPVTLDLKPGTYLMKAVIRSGNVSRTATSALNILNYKPNEVQIDRFTGGLIVNRRQFFPFGFYCYSPVFKTLPEEEVVRGFNMISPYQKILPETLNDRKAYMDRCAQLGMKVHYNILSVAGGGGVSSKIEGLTFAMKKYLLQKEIKSFMDHPALLAWYIADEPNGNKVDPDSLRQIYELVRELDPWHPVSIVFTAPYMSSFRYLDALDIVMADPYPVPDLPPSFVGKLTTQLIRKLDNEKPLWMVLQTFGGGEIWKREPTWQEIRSMTYQAVINGATGIQYFVRNGLNLFPKSVPAWGECGKMAVEVAEMTPWILSDEESRSISTGNDNVTARSYIHNGKLMILAVNKSNEPARVSISIPYNTSGKADLIFENRNINAEGSSISDILSPFGAQTYMLDLGKSPESGKEWSKNLIPDPGFEDNSSLGVPSACYARGNGERGATYFTDTREHFEGNHSLRLVTPVENGSARLRFFPFRIRPGASYLVSIWAKSDPDQGLNRDRNSCFEISIGDIGYERFYTNSEWKEYSVIFKVPHDFDGPGKINLTLQMPSSGVGWFDMLQAAECGDIRLCRDPEFDLPF